MRDAVTVLGAGSATGTPDVLRIGLSVVASAADVAGALDQASAALHAMLAVLTAHGVAQQDVSTDNLSVLPDWSADREHSHQYQCQQGVRVALRDLATSGAVLRELAGAGGDLFRISDVSRDISDRSELAAAAREAAFADARAQAQHYAGLSGRALGDVVWIAEAASRAGLPLRGRSVAYSAAASPPITAGQVDVETSVRVRWALV